MKFLCLTTNLLKIQKIVSGSQILQSKATFLTNEKKESKREVSVKRDLTYMWTIFNVWILFDSSFKL